MSAIITIENLKELNKLQNKMYLTNPDASSEDEKMKYKTLHQYILCSSPIREKQEVLRKYASATIYIEGSCAWFYLISAPAERTLYKQFTLTLKASEVAYTHFFELPKENYISVCNIKKDVKVNFWNKQLPTLTLELKAIQFVKYKPVENPTAPFLFPEKKYDESGKVIPITIEEYLKGNSGYKNIKRFHYNCLVFHLLLASHLCQQEQIRTVAADIVDIRPLLPAKFPVKDILELTPNGITVEKRGLTLFFTFSPIFLHVFKAKSKYSRQYCTLPFYLVNTAFKQKNLGVLGVNFLLMFIFGYRYFETPTVQYKPSTFIKLCGLSPMLAKRGISKVAKTLTRWISFLHKAGMLYQPVTITPAVIRADKGIYFRLSKSWEVGKEKPDL